MARGDLELTLGVAYRAALVVSGPATQGAVAGVPAVQGGLTARKQALDALRGPDSPRGKVLLEVNS